nr:TGB3 [Garlic yellow virus]QED44832.1 TGB3 [Garlic yellow virus]
MLLHELKFVILSFCIVYALCLVYNAITTNGCTVIVTGESVKLLNCIFDENFVAYAKELKPFGSL